MAIAMMDDVKLMDCDCDDIYEYAIEKKDSTVTAQKTGRVFPIALSLLGIAAVVLTLFLLTGGCPMHEQKNNNDFDINAMVDINSAVSGPRPGPWGPADHPDLVGLPGLIPEQQQSPETETEALPSLQSLRGSMSNSMSADSSDESESDSSDEDESEWLGIHWSSWTWPTWARSDSKPFAFDKKFGNSFPDEFDFDLDLGIHAAILNSVPTYNVQQSYAVKTASRPMPDVEWEEDIDEPELTPTTEASLLLLQEQMLTEVGSSVQQQERLEEQPGN